jgi:hypothetical protein
MIGIVSSTLFTLKQSSPYSIFHEFSLINSIFLPVFFPIQHMIKPSLFQWFIMAIGGFGTLITGLLAIKMMQN